ncbi:hypothetical protein CLAFUW4_05000 [Fulvia fulva]|uniref:SPRY domain-containing protein n=1 Tax=Passalora fulva TaxID=5499 RepID=A0A9Q8UUR8_PASFU|nr:uncharacterized protein CLAFUR5_11907 [Fulvia fulva]KAK4627329.1 hypothetical protein CLAFUR4_04986 [Fulvia fulva]KAK4628377.1 hypothetical protein CLAFUR0_04990 [Fulvia fulva]UJO23183.1 hypothetical protein CLAFUR5_11907 [Fulvia fulva]WPV14140.1 hypothetical protein CLAFUW4_05000 [Fulvia fulva]WPV28731.1 hypothetical protein CLAFUW7_04994 [Fulvia fulva]
MGDKYQAPPGPPPNYRSQSTTEVQKAQDQDGRQSTQPQPGSWTVGGGSSSRQPEMSSNKPFREPRMSATSGQRPASLNVQAGQTCQSPPSSHPSSRPSSHQVSPQGPPSNATSDVEMSEDEEFQYQPPPGPPPGRASKQPDMDYSPPPGPPPGHGSTQTGHDAPPEYDPWVGDDGGLRPPPAFSAVRPENQRSPAANADFDDAARAHAWCRDNTLWNAVEHDGSIIERIQVGDMRLTFPPNTMDITNYQPGIGRSYIRTTATIGDTILLSDIPAYASHRQNPLATGRSHTVYFELHVQSLGDRYNPNNNIESGVAIGFVAPAYPAWRLPGWHRGSLGVHSDDGRRYVDNSYGGNDFVAPFKKGDVVGIGMTFAPPRHGDRNNPCQVFFTRNGKHEGAWDLHEERDRDADEGDVAGLEGDHDLLAAVGVFGSVELEAVFHREDWLYKPQE